jgi:hypothetical protein
MYNNILEKRGADYQRFLASTGASPRPGMRSDHLFYLHGFDDKGNNLPAGESGTIYCQVKLNLSYSAGVPINHLNKN